MKKLILTCGLFLAGVCFAFSQVKTPAPTPATAATTTGGVEKSIAHLKQVCNITADQEAKIKPMIEARMKAMADNKTKYASDPKEMKEANDKTKDSYKTQLKSVLTPEQFEKLKASMSQSNKDKEEDK